MKRTHAVETFDYITKTHCEALGLPKTHALDALIIASWGKSLTFKTEVVYLKKGVPRGDYQQTRGV